MPTADQEFVFTCTHATTEAERGDMGSRRRELEANAAPTTCCDRRISLDRISITMHAPLKEGKISVLLSTVRWNTSLHESYRHRVTPSTLSSHFVFDVTPGSKVHIDSAYIDWDHGDGHNNACTRAAGSCRPV